MSPTTCSPSPRTARSTKSADRLGVEGGVPAGDDDGVRLVAVGRVQRDPGEVERLEQVRVAELGGEADAEQVELADGPVPVDGELRDAVLAHEPGQVRPDGVGALGEGVRALVEHLVEDHQALVGQPDLVGVGIHQRPVDRDVVPRLDLRVQLTADVLDRLLDLGQQRFEAGVQGLTSHDRSRVDAPFPPPPAPTEQLESPGPACPRVSATSTAHSHRLTSAGGRTAVGRRSPGRSAPSPPDRRRGRAATTPPLR